MENKYKQVTNILNELAEQNPFITQAQIAKAKSMYNGDTRSIDVIRAKLEAYSNEIMAQGLKAKEEQKLERAKEEPIVSVEHVAPELTPEPLPIFTESPVEIEQEPETPTASQPATSESGYGNVTALLALTIMFSIVTIIMAFFTIIAN